MGRHPMSVAALLFGLTLARTATAAEVEGRSDPLAWRATDVQQNTTTVAGKRHARHEFLLTLKNPTADPLTITGYEASVSYVGVTVADMTGPVQLTLPAGAEHRVSLFALIACPDESRACRFAEGPSWRIAFAGRADTKAFTAPIEFTLPLDAHSPVAPGPKMLVTPVLPNADTRRLPATFRSSVILVPASMNGQDLMMLFDTGAQVSMLRPDTARRLGIVVPADAPALPIASIGAPAGGALVRLPPMRVGDYVVEHMTAAVTNFAEFPFVIDGILGANFIEAFRVSIDHRAKELRLEPAR